MQIDGILKTIQKRQEKESEKRRKSTLKKKKSKVAKTPDLSPDDLNVVENI